MNTRLKELGGQFQSKYDEAQALLKKEGLSAEDVTRIEALNAECEGIRTQIEEERTREQQVANLRSKTSDLGQWASASTGGLPVGGSFGNGVSVLGVTQDGEFVAEKNRRGLWDVVNLDAAGNELPVLIDPAYRNPNAFRTCRTDAYKAAWRRSLRYGMEGLTGEERATLQEGLDTSGGYLVPDEVLNRVIAKEPTPTRVAGYCTQLNTSRDALAIPKVNYTTDNLYTTGMRVTWTGEVPASSTTHRVTDPVFGSVRVPVYTAMMSIPVTLDLLEDSLVALEPWLAMKFGETIELLRDNMVLNGSSVNQPSGILVNPGTTNNPDTVVTGSAAALTADGIQSLIWSLPEQYDDSARVVFNKTNTGQALAKLKDGDGRYLWGAGLQDSGLVPDIKGRELLGYPVNFSGFMPNVGANAYPIIFGDFRGYYIVNRVGFSIQVLREIIAQDNQILLLGRVRFGGMVAEEWRFKIQKCST